MGMGMGTATGCTDNFKPYDSTASSSRSDGRSHCASPSPSQHTQHTQYTQHILQHPNRGSDQPAYARLTRTYSKDESDTPRTRGPPSVMSDLEDRAVWPASPSSVGGSGMGDRARPVRTDSPSLIRRRRGSDGSSASNSSYLGGTYSRCRLHQ